MTNPWAKSDEDEFIARLETFADESGGLMRLCIVRPDDAALKMAILKREPLALTLVMAAADGLRKMATEERERQCLLCDHRFTGETAAAFVMWVPGGKTETIEDHNTIIAQPICAECAKIPDEEIADRSTAALKRFLKGIEISEVDGAHD